ncbi:MAG: type I glyceraldehyde-3-phosphate dehydrogenase, partial [bacterium]
AHLLKYDSIYGTYAGEISAKDTILTVDGKDLPVFSEKEPNFLPWKKLGVDVVLECTGKFRTLEQAERHITAGAKQVIISAPAEDGVPTVVKGVNTDHPTGSNVVSNASCTTNCISPIAAVLQDAFGVAKAVMTTIHAYTADQALVDGPHKDLRRARAAGENLVPTTTGAALATTEVIPELKGLFDGLSIRVPVSIVSLADITFVVKRKVTKQEVDDTFVKASQSPRYKGILEVTDLPLVSSDFKGNPASAVVDLSLTQVVDGDLVKIVAWYDNEWGYANRLVELAAVITG